MVSTYLVRYCYVYLTSEFARVLYGERIEPHSYHVLLSRIDLTIILILLWHSILIRRGL